MKVNIQTRILGIAGTIAGLVLIATPALAAAPRAMHFYDAHPLRIAASRGRANNAAGAVTWNGTVTSVNGSSFVMQSSAGPTVNVDAGNATVTMKDGSSLPVDNIELNDSVTVTGTLNGSTVTARRITDNSLSRGFYISGAVTSVSGTIITVQSTEQGAVIIHAVNSSIGNIAIGSRVRAIGSWDAANKALWTTDIRVSGNNNNGYNYNGYNNSNGYYNNGANNGQNVAVNGNVNGSVLIVFPSGATLANGSSATVTANANDPDGIGNLVVYANGAAVQSCPSSNYPISSGCSVTLYGGNYSGNVGVYAVMTDRNGNATTSSTSYLSSSGSATGNANGSVSLSLSPYASTLANGQSTTATATAYDADGLVSVAIYANGSLVQSCAVSNYPTSSTCPILLYGSNYAANSSVAVYAQITDRYGNAATSATTTLTTGGATTNNAGSVSLSLSPNVTTLTSNQSATASASAYDADGIGNVTLYVNGAAVQSCATANYPTASNCSFTLFGSSYANGSNLSIYAQMTDRYGNVASSSTANLIVSNTGTIASQTVANGSNTSSYSGSSWNNNGWSRGNGGGRGYRARRYAP